MDLDGTLAVGNSNGSGYTLLSGVQDFIAQLRAKRLPFVVFTNGTAQPPGLYVDNLASAGLHLDSSEMMTPSSVAANYFISSGFRAVLVLGGEGVSIPLVEAGIQIVRPGDSLSCHIDAVYIGWHPNFDLRDISTAADAVLAGAQLFVSSNASFFYTSKGRMIGVSGIIGAAVTKATGEIATVVGKPSAIAALEVSRRLGCAKAEIAIVGDDPNLETEMARINGAISVGVVSGLTSPAAWKALPFYSQPHFIVNRIDQIISHDLIQLEGQ